MPTPLTLTSEQRANLEFQVTQAFDAFKKAVDTREHDDIKLAEEFCSGLNDSLYTASRYGFYWEWPNRRTQRSKELDTYISPYMIMSRSLDILKMENPGLSPLRDDVTEETLKRDFDNKNRGFFNLGTQGEVLARSGKFESIINALEYIMKDYQQVLVH